MMPMRSVIGVQTARITHTSTWLRYHADATVWLMFSDLDRIILMGERVDMARLVLVIFTGKARVVLYLDDQDVKEMSGERKDAPSATPDSPIVRE